MYKYNNNHTTNRSFIDCTLIYMIPIVASECYALFYLLDVPVLVIWNDGKVSVVPDLGIDAGIASDDMHFFMKEAPTKPLYRCSLPLQKIVSDILGYKPCRKCAVAFPPRFLYDYHSDTFNFCQTASIAYRAPGVQHSSFFTEWSVGIERLAFASVRSSGIFHSCRFLMDHGGFAPLVLRARIFFVPCSTFPNAPLVSDFQNDSVLVVPFPPVVLPPTKSSSSSSMI